MAASVGQNQNESGNGIGTELPLELAVAAEYGVHILKPRVYSYHDNGIGPFRNGSLQHEHILLAA